MKSVVSWAQNLYERVFETEVLRRIIKNSSYLLGAVGVTTILGVVQTGYVTRLLDVHLFGLFGTITNFSNVINRFTSFRINEMVVRNVRHFEESGEQDKSIATYKLAGLLELVGALLAFLLIWWLAPWAARNIGHDQSTAPLWVLYGVVVVVNFVYESSTGLLQVFDRFRNMALINTAQSVVTVVLAILAYMAGGSIYEVIWIYIAGKAVGAAGVMGAAFATASDNWGKKWWRTPISSLGPKRRELLRFSFSTNVSGTISIVAKDSEQLWVSWLLGPAAAGYYRLALYFINIMKLPINPLPQTTYPELSREMAKGNWDVARTVLKRGSLLAAVYSLPVALAFAVFGRQMIELISGVAYSPAYYILLVLLVGYTFDNIFFWNRVALLALNHPLYPTIVNFIGMVLKIAGIFLLFDVLGRITFAAVLSGYYIFTVGLAALRVHLDLKRKLIAESAT